MDIQEAVFAFDGRSVEDLQAALDTFQDKDASALLELGCSRDPLHRVAATWIAKGLLSGGRGDALDVTAFLKRLPLETESDAVLHLLQCVQFAPGAARDQITFIRARTDDKKVFVAVWALDAWVRVALETQDGLTEVRHAVENALGHEKASMRARARHLAPLLGL